MAAGALRLPVLQAARLDLATNELTTTLQALLSDLLVDRVRPSGDFRAVVPHPSLLEDIDALGARHMTI
jgi:hypothetical protein